MKLCRPLRSVCLYSLFSLENKDRLFDKCVGITKAVNEDLCLLIEISSQNYMRAYETVS